VEGVFEVVYPSPELYCAAPVGDQVIVPDGDRLWKYFVRRGTLNKVVVEFEGGGGCWDEESCTPGGWTRAGLYKDWVNVYTTLDTLNNDAWGIHDHTDIRNPFREWTHIFIPYCSGDLFISNTRAYWDIQHRGWTHGQAALDWMIANVPTPTHFMITGWSAGGYGSSYWAPLFFEYFAANSPSTRLYHHADSSPGTATQIQLAGTRDYMNLTEFLSQGQVPGYSNLDYSFTDPYAFIEFSSDVLGLAAAHYPQAVFSSYTYHSDVVAIGFVQLGGLDMTSEEWIGYVRDVFSRTAQKAENGRFAYWIQAGAQHCSTLYPRFYRLENQGIMLWEWLMDMVNDEPIPLIVDCIVDGCNTTQNTRLK